jgi:hypothetical protein
MDEQPKVVVRYLQRLEMPREHMNPFNFGGGLRNGGLSDEAAALLRPLFCFYYMGDAAFEYGAMPESFDRFREQRGKYVLLPLKHSLTVSRSKMFGRQPGEKPTKHKIDFEVFCICRDDWRERAAAIIKTLSSEREVHGVRLALKCGNDFPNAVYDFVLGKPSTIGWMDIENDYFIFLREETAVRLLHLFEVPGHTLPDPNVGEDFV